MSSATAAAPMVWLTVITLAFGACMQLAGRCSSCASWSILTWQLRHAVRPGMARVTCPPL